MYKIKRAFFVFNNYILHILIHYCNYVDDSNTLRVKSLLTSQRTALPLETPFYEYSTGKYGCWLEELDGIINT